MDYPRTKTNQGYHMDMNRRTFMQLTTGSALFAVGAQAQKAKRPNIIFVMADDLGYGHVGCYGQDKIRTPNIDRIAAEGIKYTDAYAGCPQCAPSRSVLMTGLHAGHTPVRGNAGGIPLRDEDVTVAEVLQKAGYATGLFGKWGLGEAGTTGIPRKQGFDEFFGYLHQKHAHFYYTDYLWHNEEKYPLEGNKYGKRTQYTHDVIMEKALDWIGEDRDEPFFCFVSLTIPHHEWTVPESSLNEYLGKFDEDEPQYTWREGYALPRAPKANMAAMITHMDEGVGDILDLLDEKGMREDTLVIFTSDNGPDRYSLAEADFFNASGPLRGYKYDMYEGGLRVPTVATWPGTIEAGRVSDEPWYFADIMPTFAELADAEAHMPDRCDGWSIVPNMMGKDVQQAHLLYWETNEARACRYGKWKLVQPEMGSPIELYDLENDVGESNNVASENEGLVTRITRMMDSQHEPAPPQINPDAPDGQYYH